MEDSQKSSAVQAADQRWNSLYHGGPPEKNFESFPKKIRKK